MLSCILYIPNTKLSDQYLWPQSDGLHKKSSIFDRVRPLPCSPIKPAGSKPGTVDKTSRVCRISFTTMLQSMEEGDILVHKGEIQWLINNGKVQLMVEG